MKRVILYLSIFSCLFADANARDLGQRDAVKPGIRQWYQALMQPDVPNASCCGEADGTGCNRLTKSRRHHRDRPTNRAAGLTSTSEPKLKFRTINSSGTDRIPPATASYS